MERSREGVGGWMGASGSLCAMQQPMCVQAALLTQVPLLACPPCSSDNTWSLYPGMISCLKCVNGVPNASGTPSPGYHVLNISAPGTLGATCNAAYKPALTTTCGMTTAGTMLSVFVDYVSGAGAVPAVVRAQVAPRHSGCPRLCPAGTETPPCCAPLNALLQDCSVTITPILDAACAEPLSQGYDYSNMAIQVGADRGGGAARPWLGRCCVLALHVR